MCFTFLLKTLRIPVVSPPVSSLNLREFQFAQSLIFALEEINNSSELLPGLSLGYRIYDACGYVPMAIRSALALMNRPSDGDTSCSRTPTVLAIIGESGSSPTIGISSVTGPFNIPVVRNLHVVIAFQSNRR